MMFKNDSKVHHSHGGSTSTNKDCYLGLLYPTEEYQVYGYVSNTRMKYIVITNNNIVAASMINTNTVSTINTVNSTSSGSNNNFSTSGNVSDIAIKALATQLHQLYIEVLSNPFYTLGEVRIIETRSCKKDFKETA